MREHTTEQQFLFQESARKFLEGDLTQNKWITLIECVEDGYLRCGGLWGLPMDNHHDDYVVVHLGDLGQSLCYTEQLHWKSCNISPCGGLSPGEPLKPLTVARIKRGNCQPCSRNPVLGQYLNHLRLMDQRGSGIGRMKSAMLDHGLDEPIYDLTQGYFRVTLKGPGDDLDRLRVPAGESAGIPPAIADQLSKRQISILEQAVKDGKVTTGWVVPEMKVVKDTAVRDLKGLCDLGLLRKQGKGRGVHYVPEAGQ